MWQVPGRVFALLTRIVGPRGELVFGGQNYPVSYLNRTFRLVFVKKMLILEMERNRVTNNLFVIISVQFLLLL
jgi:hypothetical protein